MNAPYVIDASVYVARTRRNEPGFAQASSFLRRVYAERWLVYLPAIALPEVVGNVARTTGKSSFAQRVLITLLRPHVEIIDVNATLGRLATELAIQHRIRGCDAIYVALAHLRNAVLITLDQEQRRRIPPTLAARTPAEELALLPP